METEVVRATQDWETEKTSWGRVKTDGGGEWPDQQRQRDGESKAEDNKEQGAKEIKTSGVGKAVPEESPVCLSHQRVSFVDFTSSLLINEWGLLPKL